MYYSKICPDCGSESTESERECPFCGAVKNEIITKGSFAESVIEQLALKLNFLDQPVIYLRLFFKLIFLITGLILIPEFIWNSEIVYLILTIYLIFGIIKDIDENFLRLKGIYVLSRLLLAAYIGAGLGCALSYSGLNSNYDFSRYFNPLHLWNEILNKNFLIFVGMFAGIGFAWFIFYFIKSVVDFKDY